MIIVMGGGSGGRGKIQVRKVKWVTGTKLCDVESTWELS